MTRAALDQIVLGESTLGEKLAGGEADIAGSQEKLVELLSMLDTFELWFNIVTP
jgi:alkyl sulfatase BDS1-like metallo-beta-lactamase superfamily hydrolase